MYRFVVAAIATTAMAPAFAQGADSWPSVPPITGGSELGNYCLYNNTIYSVGATICVRKQGLVCVPPPNPNAGPNTGGRAYWSANTVDTWVPPAVGQCP